MADKTGFPQVPGRVWWGVREMLNARPKMKFDDATLAATLDVQPAAARQYLAELKRLGILDENGGATELGERWRHDEGYDDVVDDLLSSAYPEALMNLAPPGGADRAKVERWFAHAGLGTGTAKNKAGTYLMIANDRPGETKVRASAQRSDRSQLPAKPKAERRSSPPAERNQKRGEGSKDNGMTAIPLNLNVQIHISADATSEQIESIFAAMRKYLRDEAA